MTKYAAAFALLAFSATSATADIFTYSCKVQGKTFPLKIDSARRTFIWKGKTFNTTELLAGEQQDCPRFGWRVKGQGETFDFCTATQGMADFKQNGLSAECDQKP